MMQLTSVLYFNKKPHLNKFYRKLNPWTNPIHWQVRAVRFSVGIWTVRKLFNSFIHQNFQSTRNYQQLQHGNKDFACNVHWLNSLDGCHLKMLMIKNNDRWLMVQGPTQGFWRPESTKSCDHLSSPSNTT